MAKWTYDFMTFKIVHLCDVLEKISEKLILSNVGIFMRRLHPFANLIYGIQ